MTRWKVWGSTALLGAIVLAVAISGGCGDDDGDGDGGSSAIGGNVATASTAAVESRETWFAWVGTEVLGFAKRAWAQVVDTTVDGISVTAASGNDTAATATDNEGDFSLVGPDGDVVVTLNRGNCSADVALPDVPDESTITLENIDFPCTTASPSRIAEAFEGRIVNKPASQSGNLLVCVESGDRERTRTVRIAGAAFESSDGSSTTFADIAEGDRILVEGERVGQGAPSTLDADLLVVLASGDDVSCGGVSPTATPEPESTPTPEPTATPPL